MIHNPTKIVYNGNAFSMQVLSPTLTQASLLYLPQGVGELVLKKADGTSQDKPYKVYTALLTQTDTNDPVAIVLENTLGVITYSRDEPGFYKINSSGLFIQGKTVIFYNGASHLSDSGYQSRVTQYPTSENFLLLNSDEQGNPIENGIKNNSIEIRIYN